MSPSYRLRLPVCLLCLGTFFFTGGLSCDSTAGGSTGSADEAGKAPATYAEVLATNVAARLNARGDSAMETGDYPTAILFFQQSMDSAAVNADSTWYYDSKLDLAGVHERLGNLNTAIQIAEPVTAAFVRSGDSTRIGRSNSTLAGFYSKAGMTEKSIAAARKGFDILKNHGSLVERGAAYNQMAFTFSRQGRWAEARPLLDSALLLMHASGERSLLPPMYLNLGNCCRNIRDWPHARIYLQRSVHLADSLGQTHIHSKAIERLSQVAEATNDPILALRLFRRAKEIRDSLFTTEKTRNLQELEIQYETREKEQEIKLLRSNEQLQKTQRNLLLAGLLAAVAIFGLGLYIQRLKLRNARQILAQKQQEMADYVEMLQAKNAQLGDLERNRQDISHLHALPEAEQINSDLDDDSTESLYNNRILTDRDWESFKYRFERIHPGYLQRLRTHYPELSGSEERLCLLIKINLNSQEIANILGITTNGVKKSRQRLRKRLAMKADDDLEAFIYAF